MLIVLFKNTFNRYPLNIKNTILTVLFSIKIVSFYKKQTNLCCFFLLTKSIYGINHFDDLAINYNAETTKFFKFGFRNLKRTSWDYLMPYLAMLRK